MTDLITEARELYNGWMAYEIMRHGGSPGAKSDDGEASKKFILYRTHFKKNLPSVTYTGDHT